MSGRSLTDTGKDVVVYLKPGDGLSAAALAETKAELVSLMRGLDVRIGWWDPEKAQAAGASLIVADFAGTCSAPSERNAVVDVSALPPLADTSVADGRILPFAHVDCGTLSQFVGALLADQPSAKREQMYGRAIGRLLAHEFYHIVAQTRDHASSGVAKERFSTTDLLEERFEFEPAAIAELQEPSASPSRERAPVGF
jgi:hypothetical protein